MSTYDLKLTDHRCQLTTTTYYLLQFENLIWWEKKKNFGRKFEKKNDDWKKNKLFAWSDYQNYFDDQNWLLIYIRNSDDKLDSIIANLVHQSTNWQKKYYTKLFAINQNWSKKMAFKNKNRKNLNCMIQHLIVSEFI